jgi:membrane protein required for colicin V production
VEVLGVNITDVVVVVTVLISGAIALARGLVKEVLAIASWVGAAFATLYGFSYASPYARKMIETDWVADLTAGGVLFIVTLFVLSLASHAISSRVKGSTLGVLDRSLGLVFGLLRGALLISLAYLAFSWVQPVKDQPKWVRSAKTMPLIEQGADLIIILIPETFLDRKAPGKKALDGEALRLEAERVMRELTTSRPKSTAPGSVSGYKNAERDEMNRLIQGSQGPEPGGQKR